VNNYSNLIQEGSIQSEEECIKRLGSIRKTYHYCFRDSDSKELTGTSILLLLLNEYFI